MIDVSYNAKIADIFHTWAINNGLSKRKGSGFLDVFRVKNLSLRIFQVAILRIMKKLPGLLILAAYFTISCEKPIATVNTNIGTPITTEDARKALAKGINLENWFNDYSSVNEYATRFSAADLARIKSQGFTCVRLPIATTVLFQANNPSELAPANLVYIDNAVKTLKICFINFFYE